MAPVSGPFSCWRYGIRQARTGNRISEPFREQHHIPDRKSAAQLQQPHLGQHVLPCHRFAHEIDGAVRRDGKGLGANPAQDRQIHRHIGQTEH